MCLYVCVRVCVCVCMSAFGCVCVCYVCVSEYVWESERASERVIDRGWEEERGGSRGKVWEGGLSVCVHMCVCVFCSCGYVCAFVFYCVCVCAHVHVCASLCEC